VSESVTEKEKEREWVSERELVRVNESA